MKQVQHSLSMRPQGQGLYEVTGEIAAWLADQPVSKGLLTVFIRHTSASLLIQENVDPDVQRDLETFLEKLGTAPLPPHYRRAGRHAGAHQRGSHPNPAQHPRKQWAHDARHLSRNLRVRAPQGSPNAGTPTAFDRAMTNAIKKRPGEVVAGSALHGNLSPAPTPSILPSRLKMTLIGIITFVSC